MCQGYREKPPYITKRFLLVYYDKQDSKWVYMMFREHLKVTQCDYVPEKSIARYKSHTETRGPGALILCLVSCQIRIS